MYTNNYLSDILYGMSLQTVEKAHIPKVRSNNLQINIFSTFLYVGFAPQVANPDFMHFCAASQLRCRTIVLSASLFLACELFRSSAQRVDFSDTLKRHTVWYVAIIIKLLTKYKLNDRITL